MRLVRLLELLLLCSSGCSSLLPPSSTLSDSSPACRYYDDAFVAWQVTAIASGSLSAAVATGSGLSEGLGGGYEAGIALGATGAVVGALAAVASWAASHYAGAFARDCLSQPGASP